MELRLVHHFACDPRTYWEATREASYEEAVRQGADVDYTPLEERDSGRLVFTRARVSPRKELPVLAQKALGQARLSYVQEIESDNEAMGTKWRVLTDFMSEKVRCAGTSRIVPAAGGCERIIEGVIEVGIPLVGGTIEKQIVAEITRGYDRAADVLRQHLKARSSKA